MRKAFLLALILSAASCFAASTHTVALTCQESTTQVTGFNFYRATVSGGPYTLLGPSATCAFTDASSVLVDGATFFYVATAVNINVESSDSNQVTAVMPITIPPAPTGLTGSAK